jgi:hypothetical protein
MPIASSIQELIGALRDRKTNITRALDDLFGNQVALDKLKALPNWSSHPFRTADALGNQPGDSLPPWAKDELKAAPGSTGLVTHPLSDDEIAHVENWPPQQKENLRAALDTAIQNGPPLQFYWELHGGASEQMDDSVAGQVIFRTPQKNVSASGWFNSPANIKVKVGK